MNLTSLAKVDFSGESRSVGRRILEARNNVVSTAAALNETKADASLDSPNVDVYLPGARLLSHDDESLRLTSYALRHEKDKNGREIVERFARLAPASYSIHERKDGGPVDEIRFPASLCSEPKAEGETTSRLDLAIHTTFYTREEKVFGRLVAFSGHAVGDDGQILGQVALGHPKVDTSGLDLNSFGSMGFISMSGARLG